MRMAAAKLKLPTAKENLLRIVMRYLLVVESEDTVTRVVYLRIFLLSLRAFLLCSLLIGLSVLAGAGADVPSEGFGK